MNPNMKVAPSSRVCFGDQINGFIIFRAAILILEHNYRYHYTLQLSSNPVNPVKIHYEGDSPRPHNVIFLKVLANDNLEA